LITLTRPLASHADRLSTQPKSQRLNLQCTDSVCRERAVSSSELRAQECGDWQPNIATGFIGTQCDVAAFEDDTFVVDLALLASAQMLVRSLIRFHGIMAAPRLTPSHCPPWLHECRALAHPFPWYRGGTEADPYLTSSLAA